jgi:hypothetical protein
MVGRLMWRVTHVPHLERDLLVGRWAAVLLDIGSNEGLDLQRGLVALRSKGEAGFCRSGLYDLEVEALAAPALEPIDPDVEILDHLLEYPETGT